MNPKAIINELRRINDWRRGDETVGQPAPGHFGDVLDAAAESLASLIASNTTLRSEARAELKQRKADVTRMEEYLRNSGRNMDEAQEQIAERDARVADLSDALARVTAERDHWIALYKERNKTAAILEDTSIALRARVAELEQSLAAEAFESNLAILDLQTRVAEQYAKGYDDKELEAEKESAALRTQIQNWKSGCDHQRNRADKAEQRNAELESNCRDLRVAYEQNASQCVQLNRELAMKPDTVEWLNGVTIQRQRAEQAEAHIADLVAALEKIAKSDPLANGRYAAHNAAQALARARLSRPNAADEARR